VKDALPEDSNQARLICGGLVVAGPSLINVPESMLPELFEGSESCSATAT
jgi:hypothetical protein